MFSIEMDFDETKITILDNEGYHEDVKFILYDDIVYVTQWDEERQDYMRIEMSPDMFDAFITSLNLPEGSFQTK